MSGYLEEHDRKSDPTIYKMTYALLTDLNSATKARRPLFDEILLFVFFRQVRAGLSEGLGIKQRECFPVASKANDFFRDFDVAVAAQPGRHVDVINIAFRRKHALPRPIEARSDRVRRNGGALSNPG